MTIEEHFKQKELIGKEEVMEATGLGENKAWEIIAGVKSICDIYEIRGKICKIDYLAYLSYRVELRTKMNETKMIIGGMDR